MGKVWECVSAGMGWDEAGSSAVEIFVLTLFTYIFIYFYFACAGSVPAHRLSLAAAHQGFLRQHTGSRAHGFSSCGPLDLAASQHVRS